LNLEIERWNESEPPEGQTLRERLESEGYSVMESRDAAGTTYGPHSHAEDQTHWIISGTLIIRVGWEEYTLRAGDRDYLPANTEHSAIVPRDEAVVYLIGVKY
jgi:quercetin dioxygenase-like cupin family protein